MTGQFRGREMHEAREASQASAGPADHKAAHQDFSSRAAMSSITAIWQEGRKRCAMCDGWYLPEEAAEHAHRIPQSGPLRTRWLASGLSWAEFHDRDPEARKWGHRDTLS